MPLKIAPGDEVRPEDRRVPHRHVGHREVERHDGVHRDRDRQDGDRHDLHRRFEAVPLLGGAAPAERQRAVDLRAPAGGAIAHQREVRNHRQEQEQHAAGEIGVDGEEVPGQRRAEVRPDLARARVREQPERQPRAAEVNDRKHRADHQREHRDHFGAARDRPAPAGVNQAQDRRDQRAGVADADPEHEVGEIEAPEHRPANAGHADAVPQLVAPRRGAAQHDVPDASTMA